MGQKQYINVKLRYQLSYLFS